MHASLKGNLQQDTRCDFNFNGRVVAFDERVWKQLFPPRCALCCPTVDNTVMPVLFAIALHRIENDVPDSWESVYDRLLERPHQLAPSSLRPRRSPGSRPMGYAATVALACLPACGEGCCGGRSDGWRRAAAVPLPGLWGLASGRRRQCGSAIWRPAVVAQTHVKMYVHLVRL